VSWEAIRCFSNKAASFLIGRRGPYPHWSHIMTKLFASFLHDESAATAIEYGLIAAGIALAIIAAVNGLGTNLNSVFTSVNTSLK